MTITLTEADVPPISGNVTAPGGSVEFLELTGQQRSVTLVGKTNPFWGVGWPRKQKTKKTVYPGNPQATIQVLGPEYENTTMSGIWRDRNISTQGVTVTGNFDQPQTARALVAIFTDLCNSGSMLRVQWQDEAWQGVMVSFEPTYDQGAPMDIAWSLEMQWSGLADGRASRSGSATPTTSPQAPVLQGLNNMDDSLTFQPAGFPVPSFGSDIAGPVSALRTGAGAAFDAMRTIQNAVMLPVAAIALLQTTAASMRAVASAEASRLTDLPYTVQSTSDRLLDVYAIETFRRTVALQELALYAAVAAEADRQRLRVVPTQGQIVTVRDGATLRSLALRFYGSADAWPVIADANNLSGSFVPAGTVIYVPPQNAG